MNINNDVIQEFFNNPVSKKSTNLCDILSKYQSDKSPLTKIYNGWHNYSLFYNFLFEEIRFNSLKLFEMGIYKGASVRAFKEYFENIDIYAADVDLSTFVSENDIKCFFCDQDNPQSIDELFKSFEFEFDIIIDDGKHEFTSNLNMLQNSIFKLKKGGIYIIEDLRFDVVDKFRPIIIELKETYKLSFIDIIIIDHHLNKTDNNIILIQK